MDIPKDVPNREWTGERESPAPVAPRLTELALQHARNLLQRVGSLAQWGGVRCPVVDELRDFSMQSECPRFKPEGSVLVG